MIGYVFFIVAKSIAVSAHIASCCQLLSVSYNSPCVPYLVQNKKKYLK